MMILVVFCNAARMDISAEKYYIYFDNVFEEVLSYFKNLIQYKFSQLEEGFRYMGFVLKPKKYRVVDWLWLVKKIEKILAPGCIIFCPLEEY